MLIAGLCLITALLGNVLANTATQSGSYSEMHAYSPADQVGVTIDKDLKVIDVDAKSAAEEAGIQPGDKILSVDGTPLSSLDQARDAMREKLYARQQQKDQKLVVGTLDVEVVRNGQTLHLKVKPAPPASKPGPTPVPPGKHYF